MSLLVDDYSRYWIVPWVGSGIIALISDTLDEWVENHDILLFWQVKPVVHVFQLSEEGPCEELRGDGQHSTFNEWILPAKEFDGMWDSLIYESGLKQRLLRYAASALLFSEKVLILFLYHGTALFFYMDLLGQERHLCAKHWLRNYLYALAPALDLHLSNIRCPQCQLVEVNAHSLFSKWFSESGKLVAKLIQKIQEMVEEENNLVFVLIDEVESLAARKAALSGSEPSDSIRMPACGSKTDFLDIWTAKSSDNIAFVDRADIKAYVGPPTLQARYEILRSCLQELLRTGILSNSQRQLKSHWDKGATQLNLLVSSLAENLERCEGMSGRSLRKLPFLAHGAFASPYNCDPAKFLCAMVGTGRRERSELPE
ncbi:hypothetical protein RHMOL_Rhmol08G0253200 [Rhododendron molle]|uniref:Uncharacterized protein n=1 Tax=Rhododendron molle TaxID=49168 RepID=A0ACC0MTS7_RHOML|nr:hypothetical protein RHMOL_Rhmol08G0253200 [Rhododendron molle]